MLTPDEFVNKYNGKAFAESPSLGVQCVYGFKIWCVENLGYSYPTKTNWAEGYWTYRYEHEGEFQFITDMSQLKNGDWCIWSIDPNRANCPQSHISMFYNGLFFGQRQGTPRREFCLKSISKNGMLGALRWKGYETMNEGLYKGCDVSEHNLIGSVDVTQFDYVIIRAAWGTHEDARASEWVNLCEALGKPYGLYHYSYAIDEIGASSEASFFLNLIRERGWNPKVGCWMDMEDADHYKSKMGVLNTELCTRVCEIWCTAVESSGYYTGIYASQSWFGTLIDNARTKQWDRWVASWGTNDGTVQRDTSDMGTMLQYSSAGGLDKDLSYINIDIYDIRKNGETSEIDALRAEINSLKAKIEWYLMQMGKASKAMEKAQKALSGEE